MKTTIINLSTVIGVVFAAFLLLAFVEKPLVEDWPVPDKYQNMKNPTTPDAENLAIAKNIYAKECKGCHGKDGLGDGPKSSELDTFPGDFSEDEFQDQSDGALFYKVTEGRDEMPGFSKKITEEDRWFLVNYMRTMK